MCNRWHLVDVFAKRFNNKLTQFVSSVPDLAWTGDLVLCTQPVVEEFGPDAFPPVVILGKLVAKLQDYPVQENHSDCSRVAQHA